MIALSANIEKRYHPRAWPYWGIQLQ